MHIKNIIKDKKALILLGFIIYGVLVRIQELGYSNLQGDEINPLDYLYENNFIHYILNQKRGPLQYLINFANTSLFGYINEFQVRLPYLLFALGGLYTLYLLTKKLFDKKTALYATALMSINGLFIAFSRIAQYQSFLFLCLPLSAYLFIRHFETHEKESTNLGIYEFRNQRSPTLLHSYILKFFHSYKFVIASATVYSLCLLAHYDALSMLPFFALYTAHRWLNTRKGVKGLLKGFTTFSAVALIPNLLFYGAMRFNPYYEEVTKTYLGNRLGFGGFMPRLPDIMPIVSLYIPKHYLLVLLGLLTIGLIGLTRQITEIKLNAIQNNVILNSFQNLVRNLTSQKTLKQVQGDEKRKPVPNKTLVKTTYIFLCLLLAGAAVFGYYPIKPRMATLFVLGASAGITIILLLSKTIRPEIVGLVGWFLFPFCTYFFIIRDPRTHIYTAILPGFILGGYGLSYLVEKASAPMSKSKVQMSNQVQNPNVKRFLGFSHLTFIWNLAFGIWHSCLQTLKPIASRCLFIAFTVFLAFESVVLWQMFVNKTPEYPWWNKTVFSRPIYTAGHSQHQKPEGVFGVPYYRGWERLTEGFEKGCLKGSFHSNEKNSISYFYTRIKQVEKDEADNLVLVEGPHSWKFIEESGYEPEKEGYVLVKTIKSKHSLPVMYIWGRNELYPEGESHCEF